MNQNQEIMKKVIIFSFIFAIGVLFVVLQTVANSPEGGKDISEFTTVFPLLAFGLSILSLRIEKISEKFIKQNNNVSSATPIPHTLLIRLAVAEAVGILGFVLGFMSRQPHQAYPYMIVSVVLMALTLLPKR